jgi:hypothetical protein
VRTGYIFGAMATVQTVIHIHPEAPGKPVAGAPCNGCGVCCLVEPCPMGVLLSRRRRGACHALRWNADSALYQCGAVVDAHAVLHAALPAGWGALTRLLAPVLPRLARRWIAAGVGCDSTLEPMEPDSPTMPASRSTDTPP